MLIIIDCPSEFVIPRDTYLGILKKIIILIAKELIEKKIERGKLGKKEVWEEWDIISGKKWDLSLGSNGT